MAPPTMPSPAAMDKVPPISEADPADTSTDDPVGPSLKPADTDTAPASKPEDPVAMLTDPLLTPLAAPVSRGTCPVDLPSADATVTLPLVATPSPLVKSTTPPAALSVALL